MNYWLMIIDGAPKFLTGDFGHEFWAINLTVPFIGSDPPDNSAFNIIYFFI